MKFVKAAILLINTLLFFGCKNQSQNEVNYQNYVCKEASVYNVITGVIDGDRYFYNGSDSTLNCVDLTSRKHFWSAKIAEEAYVPPQVIGDRVIVSLFDGTVYIFSKQGKLHYKHKFEGRIKNEIVSYNNEAIINLRGIGIISLDVLDYAVDTLIYSSEELTTSQPVLDKADLYVGDIKESLIKYNLLSKNVVWQYPIKSSLQSEVCLFGDKVFVGVQILASDPDSTYLLEIDKNSGKKLNQFDCSISIFYPPVVFSDQIVYQTKEDSIAKRPINSNETQFIKLKGNIASPMLVYNDKLIVDLNTDELMNELVIINRQGEVINRIKFSRGFGTPIIANDKVYLRQFNNLYSLCL